MSNENTHQIKQSGVELNKATKVFGPKTTRKEILDKGCLVYEHKMLGKKHNDGINSNVLQRLWYWENANLAIGATKTPSLEHVSIGMDIDLNMDISNELAK